MYSYKDRIRAVKLYIKLGKRTGVTIRQLGYPTKNALKTWYREFEQSRDLQVGYARSLSKYSDEQRQVGEVVLGVHSFHSLCAHSQVAALLGKKALGELAALPIEIEINLHGGACSTVAPGAQVFDRCGAVPLKERGTNCADQGALTCFIGTRENIEPRCQVIQYIGLAKLSELLYVQTGQVHVAHGCVLPEVVVNAGRFDSSAANRASASCATVAPSASGLALAARSSLMTSAK